jgi:hypothetical protein
MRRLGLLVLIFAVAFACEHHFAAPVFADDARAQEILKAARTAVGGEGLLQKIQSLRISGQYRRLLGGRDLSGDRELSILLPDKYLAEDELNAGGMSTAIISTRGLNGAQAWTGTSGGEGGHMVIRMSAPGGQQATPEQLEAIYRRQHQAEFSRYLLAILLAPPPSLTVEYKYAGESDVEDAHADVIDVTGPDQLACRLFFDKQTHLPLLLSYRGIKPRIMTMTAFNRPADKSEKQGDAVKRAQQEAEKQLAAEPAKREEVDFFIRLTEYKKVEGLSLPHKLTFLTESEVSEEFQISKYQLNPQFKADKFQKR